MRMRMRMRMKLLDTLVLRGDLMELWVWGLKKGTVGSTRWVGVERRRLTCIDWFLAIRGGGGVAIQLMNVRIV